MSSCSAQDSCQGLPDEEKILVNTLLGLPGSDSEWAQVFENLKLLAEHINSSLKDDGLGQFVGEIARVAELPGTMKDWRRKFEEVSKENVFGAWNDFLVTIGSGEKIRK